MDNSLVPKPSVKLLYNGKDCSKDISKYLNSLSFIDYEDEQSDELNITLNDSDSYFANLWYPEKGDKLTCSIDFGGENFDCGTLTIDENTFDFDISGDTVQVKALGTSINFPVRTNNVINHSGKSFKQIASSFASKYGFKVLGSLSSDTAGFIVQKNESDISFLKRLAKMYGYIFNIKDNALTFIKLDEITEQKPLFTLNKTDLKNVNLTDSTAKMYGKCRVQYFDAQSKTLKTYTAEGNTQLSDTLNIYRKCSGVEEAEQIALSCLKDGSKEITGGIELSIPLKRLETYSPVVYFTAGINFNLTGTGKFEGMYHIKSSKRTLDSTGLKITGDIQKC